MSDAEDCRFDLASEPWIPCQRLGGEVVEKGILDACRSAHELSGVRGDVPTQTFALMRLLIAVLHGAFEGPLDLETWESLWRNPELPGDSIADYLARHQDRFDLLHPSTPFFQVAGLCTAKGEMSELSKLVADVPNGVPFFSTRLGGDLSLSFAEAARWVVHCQAFDPSGIKSGAVGDDRVKGGKGYPIGVAWSGLLGGVLLEGRTLKETLLLNLIAADFAAQPRDPSADRPAWERDALGPAESRAADGPAGPVDLYTWQSRRILLGTTGDRVSSVLIANGDKLTPQNMFRLEPHTAWRRSEAQEKKPGVTGTVYMPREHNPDRAIWRGLASLLPAASSRQRSVGAQALSPGVLEWLGHLSTEEVIPKDLPVRVRAVGMIYGSNSSVVDDIVDDTLSLRAILAEQGADRLVGVVQSAVRDAEAAARAVGGLAGDLVAAAGGDGIGARSRVLESVFALLDPRFRDWLSTLGAESDELNALDGWQDTVYADVRPVAADLLVNVPPAAWEGRVVRNQVLTAAHAEARFWAALREALPRVFAASDGVAVTGDDAALATTP